MIDQLARHISESAFLEMTRYIAQNEQVRIDYRSWTDVTRVRRVSGQPVDVAAASGGRTWKDVMACHGRHLESVTSDRKSDWLRKSMRIYLENNPAKFNQDPLWNDGALGFLKRLPQQEEQQQTKEAQLLLWQSNADRTACSSTIS